jgi:uncharacterized protein (DUF885 family)
MIDYSDLEQLIEECLEDCSAASRERFEAEKADKVAAKMLCAQMKLSFLIEEIEMKARQSKNEVIRLEGEKYYEIKTKGSDKKITENMMTNYIAKDVDIVQAKQEAAEQEAALKKWGYIMNTLSASHIYFRNVSKNKNWSE